MTTAMARSAPARHFRSQTPYLQRVATPAPEPRRDEDSGQFEGHAYNRLELFEIAREVALLATRPGRDPRKTTGAAWNKAKPRSKWPDAPDAVKFPRFGGQVMGW